MSIKLIKNQVKTEFVEKKSKFIGYAYHVESQEDVERILSGLWKEHRKCTHICTAYRLGLEDPRGFFDDNGEPSLTAGYPMLQVLEGQDFRQTLLCSVRYFGGILLGKGGLLRAYTRSANESLEAAGRKEIRKVLKVRVSYAYSYHGQVDYLLSTKKVLSQEPIYTDLVTRDLYLEDEGIIPELLEQCSGQIEIQNMGKLFVDIDQGVREIQTEDTKE